MYWEIMAGLSFATIPFYGVRIGSVLASLKSIALSRCCDLVVVSYTGCAHLAYHDSEIDAALCALEREYH